MQPFDDKDSKRVIWKLRETGELLFDLSKNWSRLRPIVFGLRSCTDFEQKYNSFAGEIECKIWTIG